MSQPCTVGLPDKWQDLDSEWQATAPFVASAYLQFQGGVYGPLNSYPSVQDDEGRRGTMLNLKFLLDETGVTPPPQSFLGVMSSRKLGLRVATGGDLGHRNTRKNTKTSIPGAGAVWGGGNSEPQKVILAFPQRFRVRHFSDQTPTDGKSRFTGILAHFAAPGTCINPGAGRKTQKSTNTGNFR